MNEENEEFEREMNYKPPTQVEGDLVAREFADGQEEKIEEAKYITVLDFEVGRVFQYEIKNWDIDNESCEAFITRNGHRLSNCEWMVHENHEIIGVLNTN
jgi:hypothetical protein